MKNRYLIPFFLHWHNQFSYLNTFKNDFCKGRLPLQKSLGQKSFGPIGPKTTATTSADQLYFYTLLILEQSG